MKFVSNGVTFSELLSMFQGTTIISRNLFFIERWSNIFYFIFLNNYSLMWLLHRLNEYITTMNLVIIKIYLHYVISRRGTPTICNIYAFIVVKNKWIGTNAGLNKRVPLTILCTTSIITSWLTAYTPFPEDRIFWTLVN